MNPLLKFLQGYHGWMTSKMQVNFRFGIIRGTGDWSHGAVVISSIFMFKLFYIK